MKVKSITGPEFEISPEEARRIADIVHHSGSHQPDFTHRMKEFFTRYQHTAARNIADVIDEESLPDCEKEVKHAIAIALEHGSYEEIAEVIYEAMEWQTAYATLESIE